MFELRFNYNTSAFIYVTPMIAVAHTGKPFMEIIRLIL